MKSSIALYEVTQIQAQRAFHRRTRSFSTLSDDSAYCSMRHNWHLRSGLGVSYVGHVLQKSTRNIPDEIHPARGPKIYFIIVKSLCFGRIFFWRLEHSVQDDFFTLNFYTRSPQMSWLSWLFLYYSKPDLQCQFKVDRFLREIIQYFSVAGASCPCVPVVVLVPSSPHTVPISMSYFIQWVFGPVSCINVHSVYRPEQYWLHMAPAESRESYKNCRATGAALSIKLLLARHSYISPPNLLWFRVDTVRFSIPSTISLGFKQSPSIYSKHDPFKDRLASFAKHKVKFQSYLRPWL